MYARMQGTPWVADTIPEEITVVFDGVGADPNPEEITDWQTILTLFADERSTMDIYPDDVVGETPVHHVRIVTRSITAAGMLIDRLNRRLTHGGHLFPLDPPDPDDDYDEQPFEFELWLGVTGGFPYRVAVRGHDTEQVYTLTIEATPFSEPLPIGPPCKGAPQRLPRVCFR